MWGLYMRNAILFSILIGCYAVAGHIETADAQSDVLINFQHPIERTDGSALPVSEIIRTEIECNGQAWAPVVAPATAATFEQIAPGEYACLLRTIATAYDDGTGELASLEALEVAFTVPGKLAAPGAPAGGSASIQ